MLLSLRKLLVTAGLFICTSVSFADHQPLELYAVDYPPYMIVKSDTDISGIDVEVTRAAFAEMGIEVDILTAPWKRVLKNLEHGRIAGSLTCSRRPERESFIAFSDKVSEANQVAVMAKNADTSGLNVYADMHKFKVMAVEGWGIQKELEREGIEHVITQEMDNGIRSVVYRDIDIFYSGELTTLYRARQLGLQDQIKIQRFSDRQSSSFHLCLSKQHPDVEHLLKQFNTGLARIKASGVYDAIYQKYL